ncbi:MAG: UbiX family flavin prenyltransferase [Pseudomonadota bacterium]
MSQTRKHKLIIAISGASGAAYGIEMLRQTQAMADVETHLVVSASGFLTIAAELKMKRSDVEALADEVHADSNIGASIASGSYPSKAMIIAPCSMKTLGCIANGIGNSLITRAADVMLKERRRLILMARETPLNLAHLRNMSSVTEMGGIVYPPLPALYSAPPDIETMVRETVGRVLALAGQDNDLYAPWQGLNKDRD